MADAIERQVLVIEDEASDKVMLAHALESVGIPREALLYASNLAEALRVLGSHRPDIALVDLGLPDSQGPTTVRELRAKAPDLPLVVISGASEKAAAARSLQEGADDYLVKGSYDSAALDRALRYAGERRRLWTQAREKTLEAERAGRRLRAVVEANADGMLIVDERGIVRFANESARTLFGQTGVPLVASVLGVPVVEENQAVEMDGPELAGERPRLEMRAKRLDWEGSPAHLVVLRDVTEQRRLEERLRQSQKMEALGQLTGGIAHDFNNVLAVILNATDTLRDLVPSELADAQRELKEIDVSARRAAGMVRRLLGFSRRGYLRFETLDISRFTQDAMAFIHRMMDDRIRVETSFEEGTGEIRADPAALQQIFLNIAANARDAMPEGGVLTVRVRRVALDQSHQARNEWIQPGVYDSISITDTGVGMNERILERIFEPFFTTKGPDAGTGLGMAMVYGLMKQHRGLVHVRSEPGRGSQVDLYFPVATAAEQLHVETSMEPAARATSQGRGDETILVIEDEPALRRAMERVLRAAGYRVLLARNGKEGLETFEANHDRIQLVVSDLVMPQLGGREVLAGLRGSGYLCPFLLVTGYGVEYVEELRGEDVSVLTKPWGRETLLETVRKSLDAGRRQPGRGASTG